MGGRLLVLGYHNIEPTWCFTGTPGAGVRTFARQMQVLDRIATVVPLEDALAVLAQGRPLPPRAVALTFDDGYRDNLTHGAPVLARHGMPATVYLVPGFLDGTEHAWWERLSWAVRRASAPHLEFGGRRHPLGDDGARIDAMRVVEVAVKASTHAERQDTVERLVAQLRPDGDYVAGDLFLDWDGAQGLVEAGLSIGSHTMGHAILGREAAAEQQADLATSRQRLQKELQVPVDTLAYPNGERGDYGPATIAAAREAGYSHAVTTWGRPVSADTPPYEVCRTIVSADMHPATFAATVLRRLIR